MVQNTGLAPGVPGAPGDPLAGRGPDPLGPSAGPSSGAPSGPAARPHPPGLRRSARALAVSVALLAAVSLARILADWDEGRWWLVSVVGLALAGLAGLDALVRAVAATGEAHRRRTHMSGVPLGLVLVAVSAVALAGVGLRAVDDWDDLDVPAAWERLRDDVEAEPRTGRLADDTEQAAFRESARAGQCWTGDAGNAGERVDCDRPHGLEVRARVDLPRSAPVDLDAAGRADVAVVVCAGEVTAPLPGDAAPAVVVPEELEWDAGARDALCLAVWPTPVTGLRTG